MKLRWEAVKADSFNILRSEGNSTVLLANVKSDVTEYTDNTAEVGKTYTYSVRAVVGGKELQYSDSLIIHVAGGPGGHFLVRGEVDYGFYGFVPASELPSMADICSNLHLLYWKPYKEATLWAKYRIDGKTIFIPCNGSITVTTRDIINNDMNDFSTVNIMNSLVSRGAYMSSGSISESVDSADYPIGKVFSKIRDRSFTTPQGRKIAHNGGEYFIRPPYAHSGRKLKYFEYTGKEYHDNLGYARQNWSVLTDGYRSEVDLFLSSTWSSSGEVRSQSPEILDMGAVGQLADIGENINTCVDYVNFITVGVASENSFTGYDSAHTYIGPLVISPPCSEIECDLNEKTSTYFLPVLELVE